MIKRILCKLFGHKWDTSDEYYQKCTRNGCLVWRAVYVKKYPKFGEPASGWQIFDIDKLKF